MGACGQAIAQRWLGSANAGVDPLGWLCPQVTAPVRTHAVLIGTSKRSQCLLHGGAGKKKPNPAPVPSACCVRHWAHLVFGDEGFDLINILWHGLLVPLDQGCLSPLDPSQELFQKLCIRHQLGKRRLQSLLVLLRPRENLLETQRRLSAQRGKPRAGTNTTWPSPVVGPTTASHHQPGTKPGGLTSSNLARMMVIQCLIVVMQSGWQAARMTSPMPTAAFTSTLFSSTFFMNS